MIIIKVTGAETTISELTNIEQRVDGAIDMGVNATATLGEATGKNLLSSHIFTGNAFSSWQWLDTGKHSAIVTYLNAGIPHPTGQRSSAYFQALETGRRGYVGSPNKIATGNSGAYTYPHHIISAAPGFHIVLITAETLRPIYPQIMSEYVGAAL